MRPGAEVGALEQRIACPMCGQDWVGRYRVQGSDEEFWLCPECESLWRDGADPSRSTEAYLSIWLESRGLRGDAATIERIGSSGG